VGSGGVILATTDGGGHWTPQASGSTADLQAVAFADATHGWAVGNDGVGGVILATTDGGATWTPQSLGASYKVAWLTGIAAADASRAWAVGNWGSVLATGNGGAAWASQSSGSSDNLTGVHFADAAHGWACGWNGTVLATASGGQEPQPSAAPVISGLSPSSARRGAVVTVKGRGFGAARGAGTVRFGAAVCTAYVSWSAGAIRCRVPAKAALGAVKVTVTTAAGASNARSLRVKR
jgi:photosystem II stability/assembly factor-like uncharacterized protein